MNLNKTYSIGLLISLLILLLSIKASSESKTAEPSFKKEIEEDIKEFKDFYKNKFPNIQLNEFKDGVYAIDEKAREQWLEIEEFAPYEISVEDGEETFNQPFANGKSYGDCFPNVEDGIRQNYPFFDTHSNQVVTLELAINLCREKNNEAALTYGKGELANLSAYITFLSRSQPINIKVPNENAYKAYMKGKKFFYSKRGQLNFACADCHVNIAGSRLRADVLSPAIGHPTGMPVYRSKWGEIGSLHRRYEECNKNVRAKPFGLQSEDYRNLEYFQTLMSQGMEVNGPSSRK